MGHFYPRQTILVPAGLITEPNEYGQYPPGALKVTRNVTMREPGKVDQAPNVRGTVTVGDPDTAIHKLIPASDGVVYAIGRDAGAWAIFADGVVQTTPGALAFSSSGRISWAECNGRVIVNDVNGHLVHDPVPRSTDFRAAGLPQPSVVNLSLAPNNPVWNDVDQMVGYRVCVARRYVDSAGEYTLRSAPSPAVKLHHSTVFAGKKSVSVAIKWPAGAGIEPGDILELYRTNILATNSAAADPGGTFKLVQEYVLTPTDIATPPPAGLLLIDTQAPVEGTLVTPGRELYTNPGIEGETYANLRPPIARCLASFKGFCFYGHTTERAQVTLAFPGGLGNLGPTTLPAYLKGVGARTGAGESTVGSPIITGVSPFDITGVRVGQRWGGGGGFGFPAFPRTAYVTAVGVDTITMSEPAVFHEFTWLLDDAIEINGVPYRITQFGLLGLLQSLDGSMEAQVNQTLPMPASGSSPTTMTGFEITLMTNKQPFDVPLTLRATHGENYSPPLPELGATPTPAAKVIDPITKKNRVAWSKEQQPEHVPSVSETFVGFGEIYAMNATRDSIFIWCSDGLHRLGGNGGSLGLGAWQVDYSNSTLLLCAPQASTVLDELVYGYTNDGVVEIDSATNVRNLTAGVIGDILPGPRYREVLGIIMERNETDGEVLLTTGDSFEGETSERIYIYNARQKGWTYLERGEAGFGLSNITAIAMFRLPPDDGEPRVLFASYQPGVQPVYAHWNAIDDFVDSSVQYQPLYGEDPLELKRWMWADYLFDKTSQGSIDVIWNDLSFGGIPLSLIDIGMYARAGCPREVGVSHSLSPGFRWRPTTTQRRFEGISLAVKQRTNQPKERGA